MSSIGDCPYHSQRWRSLTQQTINCLRQEKLIKGQQCRIFPCLVCTCTDKKSSIFKAPQVSNESVLKWCQSAANSLINNSSLVKIVSLLYTAATSKENNLFKVLNIVYLVYQGKTDCFNPPPPPSKHDTPPTDQDTTVVEPLPEERVFFLDIPVTPTQYIGTLIGANGIHLKKLCDTFSILKIHLGEVINDTGSKRKGRRAQRTRFIYQSPVKITYHIDPSNDKGLLFEEALKKRATEVKEKREKHFQAVQDFYKLKEEMYRQRRIRAQERRQQNEKLETLLSDFTDLKIAAKTNYTSGKQGKDKRREKPAPVLTDSHCLHCLITYSPGTPCKFHPGFAVLKKRKKKTVKAWSCCNSNYRTDSTLHENHVKTGCSTGQHIWRPHTTKKTKPTQGPMVAEEDIVLQPNKE